MRIKESRAAKRRPTAGYLKAIEVALSVAKPEDCAKLTHILVKENLKFFGGRNSVRSENAPSSQVKNPKRKG